MKLIIFLFFTSIQFYSFSYTTKKINQLLTNNVYSKEELFNLKQNEIDLYEKTANYENLLNSEFIDIYIIVKNPKLISKKLKAIIKLRNHSVGKNEYMYCISSYLLSINLLQFSPDEAEKVILEYIGRAHKINTTDFDELAYRSLGQIEFQKKNYMKARYFWRKYAETSKIQKNTLFYSSAINDIALSFLAEGNFKLGLKNTKRALAIISANLNSSQNIEFQQHLKCNLAEIYIQLEEYKKAENLLIEAYDFYKKNNDDNLHKPASILVALSEIFPINISINTILFDLNEKKIKF